MLPDISSPHLAPYIMIAILLTIFPVLHLTSPWLYCNCQFVFLNLFHPAPNAHPQSCLSSVSIESVSVLFVHLFCLDSTYKWNHMVFVFLCLTSLSIIHSRYIHVVANCDFIVFLWQFCWAGSYFSLSTWKILIFLLLINQVCSQIFLPTYI